MNTFRYTKDQVVRLAGWYRANKELGHGFSTAIQYALTPASPNEDAIWPDATLETVHFIADMLEKIQRVDNGEEKFWWTNVRKPHSNSPNYIEYRVENWAREGLDIPVDEELERPILFKADYTLDLREPEPEA